MKIGFVSPVWFVCSFALFLVLIIQLTESKKEYIHARVYSETYHKEWETIKEILKDSNKGDLIIYNNQILVLNYAEIRDSDVRHSFNIVSIDKNGNLSNSMKSWVENGEIKSSRRSCSLSWTGTQCDDCHVITNKFDN